VWGPGRELEAFALFQLVFGFGQVVVHVIPAVPGHHHHGAEPPQATSPELTRGVQERSASSTDSMNSSTSSRLYPGRKRVVRNWLIVPVPVLIGGSLHLVSQTHADLFAGMPLPAAPFDDGHFRVYRANRENRYRSVTRFMTPAASPRIDVPWSSEAQPSPVDDGQCVISWPGHA
jgi:hypothetical protein